MNKRAAIYTRVSSEMQLENYSLDAQENACQSFCQLKGWQVVTVYQELGKSAKDTNRPEFQRMMLDAQAAHFDFLVVHKLDRFSRSVKDSISQIEMLEGYGVGFASVTEQFDFSTPHGKLMLSVLSGVAEWYRNNLAQEISKGKRQRAKAGDWNGTLSYGYTTPKLLKERLLNCSAEAAQLIEAALSAYPDAHESQALLCPFTARAVVLAFERYSTGQYSMNEIAQFLNEQGYRCKSRDGSGLFSKTMIIELLQNRFYLGETSYGAKVKGTKRQWTAGNHPALISQGLFDTCQQVRVRAGAISNKTAHNRKRPYPLSPLMYSLETEKTWRGQFKYGKRQYIRTKRGHAIPQITIDAEDIEEQLIAIISQLKIPDEWQQQVMKAVVLPKDHTVSKAELEKRLERLKNLYLLGDISETDYRQQRHEIKAKLGRFEGAEHVKMEELNILADLLKNIGSVWAAATLEEKDQIVKMLVHRIYTQESKIAVIEPSALLWILYSDRCGEDRIRTYGAM